MNARNPTLREILAAAGNPTRLTSCFTEADMLDLKETQLNRISAAELFRIPGFGRGSLYEFYEMMIRFGANDTRDFWFMALPITHPLRMEEYEAKQRVEESRRVDKLTALIEQHEGKAAGYRCELDLIKKRLGA